MVITLDQLKTSLQIIKEYVDELGAYMKNAISDIPTNNNQLENGAGYQTEAEVKSIVADKIAASLITNTASGAIASFPDGADSVPVKDLVAQIEPVQDLHGYDAPWPAGGGVNKFAIGDATPVSVSTGATYGLTIELDAETETVRIHGTPTWTSSGAYTFRCISTKKGSYYGDAKVSHDYTGMSYKVFPVSLSSNVSSIDSNLGVSSEMITVTLHVTDTATLDVTFRILFAEAGTTITKFTPYSNICPISGWIGANVVRTGFNQWDEEWELGIYNTTTGEKESSSNQIRCKNGIPVIPNATYYLKVPYPSTLTNFCRGLLYDADDNFVGTIPNFNSNGILYTVPNNVYYIRFFVSLIYGTTYKNDICINFSDPSKNGTYDPYQSNTYSITFPTEAGTVYGGTLDVTTGVLTVDRAYLTNEQLVASTWESAGRGVYVAPSAYALPNVADASYVNPKLIASALPTKSQNVIYTDASTQIGIAQWWGNRFAIGFADSSISSVSAFKKKLAENGTDIVYPLAEPQTYQLTPQEVSTLLGQNNIWADTGDTTVDYRANTKLYIEKLTAPTEDDMTANTNIPSGTYFMVGNTLYLSTTTIPAGDTINPGTNCTLMTLASALNALNA